MKQILRPIQRQKPGVRQVLLLVALLLFLPFAQAQHLATHDLTISDIECQVCHSCVDIEGEQPKDLHVVTIRRVSDVIVISKPAWLPCKPATHKAIRAPPVH